MISALAILMFSAQDRAIIAALPHSDSSASKPTIVRRAQGDGQTDIVVTQSNAYPGFALLLQDRHLPDKVFLLAVAKDKYECSPVVDRVTVTDVTVSCSPEKFSRAASWKFTYDLKARKLLRQIRYESFSGYRIFTRPEGAVFILSDRRRLQAVAWYPQRNPAFRVMGTEEARPWILRVPTLSGIEGMEKRAFIFIEQKTPPPPRQITLPRTTWDQFAAARPAAVHRGYRRGSSEIHDSVGPWQLDGGRIWFGKSFYDGEGLTGVGGFGYLDSGKVRPHLYSPPEIANWSVTAMTVGPADVWMALAELGETGSSGGGLLRFDRDGEMSHLVKFSDVATAIARVGDRVVIASDFGIGILEADHINRFFVEPAAESGYKVVAVN